MLKSLGTAEFFMPAISKLKKSCPAELVLAESVIVTVRAVALTVTPSSARPPIVELSAAVSPVTVVSLEQVLPLVTEVKHLNRTVPVPGPFKSERMGLLTSCLAPEISKPVGKVKTIVPPAVICLEMGRPT